MAYIIMTILKCDVCKTPSEVVPVSNVDKVREVLSESGWVFNRATQQDICPAPVCNTK